VLEAASAASIDRARTTWQACRPFLDLASENPRERILAYGILTVAITVIALWGSSFGGPLDVLAGWLPLLAVLWVTAPKIEVALARAIEERPISMLASVVSVWTVILVMQDPTASDDLLRHLAAWAFHYDYQSMFVYSTLPSPSLYPLFDHAAGFLAQHLGMVPAMHVVQLAALLSVIGPVIVLAHRRIGSGPARGTFLIVAVTLAICLSLGRIALGRPEVFLTGWVLAAMLPRGLPGIVAWLVAGLLLSACHLLAPIYFIAVLLLPAPLRVRLAIGLALFAWHVAFWWIYSDGAVLAWLELGAKALANRQADIEENMTIGMALFRWPFLLCAAGLAWLAHRRMLTTRSLLVLTVAAWFIVSGQIRYATTVGLLLLVALLDAFPPDTAVLASRRWRLTLWTYAAVVLLSTPMRLPNYDSLPRFVLPDDARALTGMGSNFSVIFHNAGKVRVAPALELGATRADVQRLAFGMDLKGRLDCELVVRLGFTHVVEKSLVATDGPPPCLRLAQTQGPWREWVVEPR